MTATEWAGRRRALTSIESPQYAHLIDEPPGGMMQSTTVSPKLQVVMPPAVRKALGQVSGVTLQVARLEDRNELIPLRAVKSLRGRLAGIDTSVPRDGNRS